RVHRRDQEVELRQDVIGIVELAVGEDVTLDPLEPQNAVVGGVELVDLVPLAAPVIGLHSTSIRGGARVIGDSDPLAAGVAARERELRYRVGAVRVAGVTVQEAAQVRTLEQRWHRAAYLLTGLAQLGRNPRQS